MDPAVSPDGPIPPEPAAIAAAIEDEESYVLSIASFGSDGRAVSSGTATLAARVLSEDFARRLQRAEVEVAAMTQAQREATCDWLGAMLHRPPLENPRPAWAAMRALVEALWWDIADRTPADVADPDAGNERLVPNHPWGEGADS